MARHGKSRAFRKGFLLGGMVGAGLLLWNAPQPGWRTREQFLEKLEGLMFKVLDMPVNLTGESADAASEMFAQSPVPDSIVVEAPVGTDTEQGARQPSGVAV